LAFALYGDLDISVIDEMPPGRKPVETLVFSQKERKEVYKRILMDELASGGQAYIVAPLIEESEDEEDEGAGDIPSDNGPAGYTIRSAESLYEGVSAMLAGTGKTAALLHGRMKQAVKDEVMKSFADGETDVLVSTTVIEVGVNVPNATLMIVENAERFGLAQLHQLRGRVGRGERKSMCVLISEPISEEAAERAQMLKCSNDGLAIAEADLKMRGPGELFGLRQHGLPTLRIADLAKHINTAKKSAEAAEKLIGSDPLLEAPENRALKKRIKEMFKRLHTA
jgi:ATP-dependent DNA helicase RecG